MDKNKIVNLFCTALTEQYIEGMHRKFELWTKCDKQLRTDMIMSLSHMYIHFANELYLICSICAYNLQRKQWQWPNVLLECHVASWQRCRYCLTPLPSIVAYIYIWRACTHQYCNRAVFITSSIFFLTAVIKSFLSDSYRKLYFQHQFLNFD